MSAIDAFTAFAILVRALGYAGGLLAIGSGLFLVAYGGRAFPSSDTGSVRRSMRQTAWIGGIAAGAALVATIIGLCVRAGRLSGMDAMGMADPTMLQIIWEGPVGTAVTIRLAGLAAIVAGIIATRSTIGRALVTAGALAFAYSYTLVGHATEEPHWLLSAALVVHLMAAGFWFGSFAPLAMLARCSALSDAAAFLDAFGRAAIWAVAALVAAGATFAFVLVQSPGGLFGTPYGWILLVKLGLVTTLLAFAALNKFRLVPALAAGEESARQALVTSIRFEALAAVAILLTTAVLTSVATPPARAVAAVSG